MAPYVQVCVGSHVAKGYCIIPLWMMAWCGCGCGVDTVMGDHVGVAIYVYVGHI